MPTSGDPPLPGGQCGLRHTAAARGLHCTAECHPVTCEPSRRVSRCPGRSRTMRQKEGSLTYPPRVAASLTAAILILQACDARTPTTPDSATSGIDAPVALDNRGFRPPFD